MQPDHFNSNRLCVISTRFTGGNYEEDDLLEVACIPLKVDYTIDKSILPFNIELIPQKLKVLPPRDKWLDEEIKNKTIDSKERFQRYFKNGCDYYTGGDLFIKWVEKLDLKPGKRILPIAHNWALERMFIQDWLGNKYFDILFHPRYRDIMGMSLYDNDIAWYKDVNFPYPKNHLQYLSSQLIIERHKIYTALEDCKAIAEIYQQMIELNNRNIARVVNLPT